jgi:hypothetical protein
MNSLQQQARFDAFVAEFNTERPYEALAMKTPAEMYSGSPRTYRGLPELRYPLHDRDVLVTACGRICTHRKRINVSIVLAGRSDRSRAASRKRTTLRNSPGLQLARRSIRCRRACAREEPAFLDNEVERTAVQARHVLAQASSTKVCD